MLLRLKLWIWQLLLCVDQFGATWIFGWSYVIYGGERQCPSADETVSSVIGKAAVAGKPWGLRWEKRINAVAEFFGDGPDHCRRSIEHDEGQN